MEITSKDKNKIKSALAVNIGLAVKKMTTFVVKKESDYPRKKYIWGGACVPRISVLDSPMASLPHLVRIGEI